MLTRTAAEANAPGASSPPTCHGCRQSTYVPLAPSPRPTSTHPPDPTMSTPRTMYLPMYSSDQHPSPEGPAARARPASPPTDRQPPCATGTPARASTRHDGPAPSAAPRRSRRSDPAISPPPGLPPLRHPTTPGVPEDREGHRSVGLWQHHVSVATEARVCAPRAPASSPTRKLMLS